MDNMQIKKFEYNEKIQGYFLVKNVECKTAKNNSKYLDIILGDTYGNIINSKLWNADDNQEESFVMGVLVKVGGVVQKFNNRPQLKIEKIRLVEKEEDVLIDRFIESAPVDSLIMIEEIREYINKINNKEIQKLTSIIFERKLEKLVYYPAAKTHHHAVKGGLLYHTLSMLKSGDSLSNIYKFIKTDLLFSGIILHDLSKVDEINSNELGIAQEYTKEGKLLGHIIQGINEIDRVALEVGIDNEIKLLIQHMILSHHYHPEYGSPKKPLIPEAELLHYLDILDARMDAINKSLRGIELGEFSDRNFSLEGRTMYQSELT